MEHNSLSFMQANDYNISIRFNSNGFSLYIFDKGNVLITSKQITASLSSISKSDIVHILENELNTYIQNKDIELIVESDQYTLVPNSLFKSEDAQGLLHFQFKPIPSSSIIWNMVFGEEVVVIFAIPSSLEQALLALFPYISITHHISHFIKTTTENNINGVHIWTRDSKMDVVVIDNGKLTFCNSFVYQTPEDFTYHTLNIYEQFKLDTEAFITHIYNEGKKTELTDLVKMYVKEVVSR